MDWKIPPILMLLFSLFLFSLIFADCPNDCNYEWQQGDCNASTNSCTCTEYYTGDDCSIPINPKLNWDSMECSNGGRYFPPEFYVGWYRYCVCPLGWEGLTCTICSNNLGCGSLNPNMSQCDRTVYINQNKFYNCSVTGFMNNLIAKLPPASATAAAIFPPNSQEHGNVTLSLYVTPYGPPLLFECNFTECSVEINYKQDQLLICETSVCRTTTWSGTVLSSLIPKVAGTMTFSCSPTGACTWSQETLIANGIPYIPLQCTAGECLATTFENTLTVEPNSAYLRIFITIGVGVGTFLFSMLGAFGVYKVLKVQQVYRPFPHIEATLSFRNISCTIPLKDGSNRVILHNVTGDMKSGSVTAIMGASGAGKTTFLDILARRKNTGEVKGSIYINGEPCNKSFKRLVGYVTQDDVFLGTLTVREYLSYIALLRLPAHMNYQQKMRKVDESLAELGISHIANSRIGTTTSRGISGGERKRLAIAAELVVDPSILLLDEPTSGLDSYSATTLIQTLQQMAHGKKKRTIIMSIHQPRSDIFFMFDYLMVFAAGHAVYFGEGRSALDRFAELGHACPPNFNPADFIIDTVSSPKFNALQAAISTNDKGVLLQKEGTELGASQSVKPLLEGVDEYASSFFTQFRILTHRTFLNAFRNPFLLRAQYTVFIITGLLLGYLYWHVTNDLNGMQNRMGSLFFMCTLLSFAAITSIDLFFSERLLFLRERANGCYRTSAYFLSKAVSDLIPMRLIPPLILGATVYYMIGYQPRVEKFLIFLFTLVVLSMTATSMCFLISTLAPSIAVGNFVAILLLFFFLLFGGFLVSLESMPNEVRWITNLSFMTFSYSVLMVNEFNGLTLLVNPNHINTDTTFDGSLILSTVGMKVGDLYKDMGILCGMLGFYMVASYLALRYAVKEKR